MRQRGFTLVELVIVMILSGILSLVVMQFITRPIDIYVDQSRRARLVEQSLSVMQRLARDVRLAVPNSIRVGCGGRCVELMRAVTGGRYRALPPGDVLSFLPVDADSAFDVIGTLSGTSEVVASADPLACENGTASCVVIYNTGFAGSDLWRGDNAAALVQVGAGMPTSVRFDNSRFAGGQAAFPAQSPGQRFYITDTPVAFLCDTTAGSLRRYWGYTRRSQQSDVDSHAELTTLANPAEHALVANGVSACGFDYAPGTPTRNAVLSLRLTLTERGETVTLFEQFNVSNLP
ncbi:MAG: type II secretion system protein [Gammaproteobacteria bacterium]|nr:type II secretion system protein [Gammaproteobacteria bacterium]